MCEFIFFHIAVFALLCILMSSRYVICRRGVESAVATAYLLEHMQPRLRVFSIAGGLNAWSSFANVSCPSY
jgi:hypothetical protein